jgi:hypothetical protein
LAAAGSNGTSTGETVHQVSAVAVAALEIGGYEEDG